eukprot:SAG22_NODE_682_length_7924_cov_25.432460_7_plen_217_part_00
MAVRAALCARWPASDRIWLWAAAAVGDGRCGGGGTGAACVPGGSGPVQGPAPPSWPALAAVFVLHPPCLTCVCCWSCLCGLCLDQVAVAVRATFTEGGPGGPGCGRDRPSGLGFDALGVLWLWAGGARVGEAGWGLVVWCSTAGRISLSAVAAAANGRSSSGWAGAVHVLGAGGPVRGLRPTSWQAAPAHFVLYAPLLTWVWCFSYFGPVLCLLRR